MDRPTADDVRARSALLTARYADDNDGPNDDALGVFIDDAAVLVSAMTCRLIAPSDSGDEVPAGLFPLARRAVALKTEQLVEMNSAASRRRAISRAYAGGLRSIQAGPWAESYFGPEDAMKARRLDPDPALHEVLWALATEDCRERWIELWTGQHAPAAAIQTFAWWREGVGGY